MMHVCHKFKKRFNRNRHLGAPQRAEEETLGFISRCLFLSAKKWVD